MGKETFGKTWWGSQWLEALTEIDYSNRIPRGKSYARTGKVSKIKINRGQIQATVQGSRPRPYSVTLEMGPFPKTTINKFINQILKYPTIVSKLLNGKMDPLLLDIADDLGLQLFPEKSDDMGMHCSCPDWAVPCKHIAAVIYRVCSDIDNNPFVLFEFRDVDLVGLLKKKKINVFEDYNKQIPSLTKFIKGQTKKAKAKASERPIQDFSQLENRTQQLLKLLQNEPVFSLSGNFKTTYSKLLLKIGREAKQLLTDQSMWEYKFDEKIESIVTDSQFSIAWSGDNLNFSPVTLATIMNMSPQLLERYHPSIGHHQELFRLAAHCVHKGLATPKILEQNKKYRIIWMPAILDKKLKSIIASLSPDFGVWLDAKGKTKGNQTLTLGLAITHIINTLYSNIKSDRLIEMFFGGRWTTFNGLSEASIPASIMRWLQLYYFDLGDHYPVLEIDDKKQDEFALNITIGHKGQKLKAPQKFADFIKEEKDLIKLYDFFKDLDLLSTYIEKVGDYINSKGKAPIIYNNQTFPHFLFEISPVMDLLDIKIVLPKALKYLIRPRPSISVSKTSSMSSGLLGLAGLLEFDWAVSLGDNLVSYQEFKNIIKNATGLIRHKGTYIYLNESELLKLQKQLENPKDLSSMEVLRTALAENYQGAPIQLSAQAKKMLKELTNIKLIPPPKRLEATFRPYQHSGYSWLVKNAKLGIGSIIADDMGLGKTIQVIGFIAHLVEQKMLGKKKCIIIVPTSLIPNWEAEFLKFAKHIDLFTFYGPKRDPKAIQDHSIILTTYGIIRSSIHSLKKYKWAVSIIDESQNIKNPTAQQTKAVKSLKTDHRIAMSGTPVENRLMDYWSVMDYANKGLLGNKTNFAKAYEKPIAKEHNKQVLQQFTNITAPFILRRLKTDKSIISDLPDKIMLDSYAELVPAQAALYQKVVDEAIQLISEAPTDNNKALFKRQGLVLQMILSLKQICNHPSQWLKDGKTDPALSGKSTLLLEKIEEILDAGEKLLIFTQYKEMGDILQHFLAEQTGITPLWLHGGVSMAKRKKMVQEFQEMPHKKIFILSLKAGGTGLNLTAANHVIHYDLWWNPAVEAQATDRAFRIGQTKNVMVHRFITKNTFEEKINDLINSKKELADLTVNTGEKWIGQLSNQELAELFRIS